MFGEKLDYYILRTLTHDQAIATEEELDDTSSKSFDYEKHKAILDNFIRNFEGHFSIEPGASYLDVGCGSGGMALVLAIRGAKSVTGIDFEPRNIEIANKYAKEMGMCNRVRFICHDINTWEPPHQYDFVISHWALEHIENPKGFLRAVKSIVKSHGAVILSFGPLFHSPFGDHMERFFRRQIPWRGVLFSEKAILRLRTENFRPTESVTHYSEIVGGLNQMRYSEFLKYVRETGWEFEYLAVNSQLKKFDSLIYRLSNLVIKVPVLRDYFAISINAKLVRAAEESLPSRKIGKLVPISERHMVR